MLKDMLLITNVKLGKHNSFPSRAREKTNGQMFDLGFICQIVKLWVGAAVKNLKLPLDDLLVDIFNSRYISIMTSTPDMVTLCYKSSMEHISCVQPRSCILLKSCLYVFSMNMFELPVYLRAQGLHDHLNFSFAGRERELLALLLKRFCSHCVYFIYCLFVTLMILISRSIIHEY